MAFSSYLETHVQTELTKAIAVATTKNPKDAVDFIGNYLLKIVKDDAKTKKKNEIYARWDQEDKELELKRKEQLLIAQKKEEEAKLNQLKDEEFYTKLYESSNKVEAMFEWSKYIENKSKSSSVYIGSFCQLKQDDDDVNAVLYNAVTSKDNALLLNTTFIQSETKGVIFDLLKSEENEDGDEEEENDEENKEKDIAKQRKMIHIDNVLLPNPYKDKLHYFSYPKVGSFLAYQSTIKSYLNDEAIQAQLRPQWPRPIEEIIAEEKLAAEKLAAQKLAEEKLAETTETDNDENKNENDDTEQPEQNKENEDDADKEDDEENQDDEEKEELPPDPPQVSIEYVICMDTLGDSSIYSANILKFVDEDITKFEDVLMKIDVNQYLKQREFEEILKTKLSEYQEKLKGEIDTKLEGIEKENESNPEPLTLFNKNKYVIVATQSIWCLITDHCMKPQQSSFCRIIAAFIKLFNDDGLINNTVSQFDVISDVAWNECIHVLKDITSEKVSAYNPREIESFDIALFDKLLNEIVVEEIGSEGIAIIITILYEFVDSVCKLYKYNEEEKLKQKENVDKEEEPKEAEAE